jgi:hypothetical protein
MVTVLVGDARVVAEVLEVLRVCAEAVHEKRMARANTNSPPGDVGDIRNFGDKVSTLV